jgi:hypothetical protein
MYVCVRVICMFVMYISMYVNTQICTCMHANYHSKSSNFGVSVSIPENYGMYICMYVCMCIYIYMYIYKYTNTNIYIHIYIQNIYMCMCIRIYNLSILEYL